MENVSYADFSLRMRQRLLGKRVPINGSIEVTRRCPLRCVHCYNNLPMGDAGARRKELTFAEHCRILDEITEAGCLWLLYTGGEIFARKDFLDIYTYAKQKGLLITLFTNGTLITPRAADCLAEWRPFSIEITLYGRSKETYERITGVAGSYEHCLRGIHLLMEHGLPVKLKTMALRLNLHEIWEIKRFAEEELGLPFRFDAMINPRIDSSLDPLANRLAPQEVIDLDLQDPRRMAEWKRFADQFRKTGASQEKRDEIFQCGGGMTSFAIDPCGKMNLCVLSNLDPFDLRQGSFREGWESFPRVRGRKISRVTRCTDCELKALCGMCPANGELEKGDAEEPVNFLCQVAHLRARAIGFSVKPHGECQYCNEQRTEA